MVASLKLSEIYNSNTILYQEDLSIVVELDFTIEELIKIQNALNL